ncbi:hypothetical protein BKD09_23990 [Bradyrhizobium japonicum]|uniref:Uncharacterized protein n=1 Tax=Bradyrhizobium japonicum TaxID=375 RepID=A0A1L3FDM0_BRAJP|nr:hypothetical protein [Bradyrhizobium japonicum]APG11399.1 hypothetical protein BKD09_23990 [Bradyrhizobium japonicum]
MKATLGSPAEPAGALYFKTDVSPEQIFQAIGRLRKEARDEIDRLIRFLDSTEDHMELEPEDEGDGDSELEDDDPAENDLDDEPSLGALENHPTSPWPGQPNLPLRCDNSGGQQLWASSGTRDLEDEHDGREPDESGIGDLDGLLEQVGTQDWQQGAMA